MLVRYLLWGTVLILSMTLSACSGIEYVYNDTLVKKGLISSDVVKYEKEKGKDKLFYIPKQLGGIKFKDSTAPEGERVFLIRREKSNLIAETQIYQGDYKYFDRAYFAASASTSDYIGLQFRFEDDDKKLFEKAYFNLGANKKKEFVGAELRFEF